MMKSPFRSPYTLKVTQEYGNTSNNDWYHDNGINIPFHNGVDLVFGNDKQTFGTACVCPFKTATVTRVWFTTPNDTKGNGVMIRGSYDDQTQLDVLFWHSCEVVVKTGDIVKEGDVLCYIGNSGLCKPEPTQFNPFGGSHCHLGVFEYKLTTYPNGSQFVYQHADNGVGGAVNGLDYFDCTSWYFGLDSGETHDLAPLTRFPKYQFNSNLYFGLLSSDVIKLQERLNVKQTGFFGPLTLAAVIKYQKDNKITPTGFVGVLTRAKLNS